YFYLMSYIRHIYFHISLDVGRGFVVKFPVMSSANPSLPGLQAATSSGASGTASPTFSPLYQQIKKLILQSLQSGQWRPGDLIPSEMELAARFGVSQGTVRKAI